MQFELKAYRDSDGIVSLQSSAPDQQTACQQAVQQGYAVLSVRAVRVGFLASNRQKKFDIALFVQELLALMEAGMGLVESLGLLVHRARQADVQDVLSRVLSQVGEGHAFSQALDAHSETFPVLLVASVRAAERTGNLVEGLRRYLAYHRQVNALRTKVITASIYPILLMAVGLIVLVFLMVYVVPRFSLVYASMGEENLPVLSRWLMHWGQLVAEHAVVLLTGVGVAVVFVFYLSRSPSIRAGLERRLWDIPKVGEQVQIYQLARFTRTVAMLLKAGIPLVSALDMTAALLRQPALQVGLIAARQALREGKGLAETFREQGLATEIGARLLVVGERSGALDETMERIAAFYDEETARQLEWFSRLFEPILMVVMGLLIGGIVILMYLPIFQLASSIQ